MWRSTVSLYSICASVSIFFIVELIVSLLLQPESKTVAKGNWQREKRRGRLKEATRIAVKEKRVWENSLNSPECCVAAPQAYRRPWPTASSTLAAATPRDASRLHLRA